MRVLLRDSAYEQLEAAIIDGTLRPGERLRDDELGRWIGVSRTPVREALARLADARLVETAANRYTRVAPLDIADARTGFAIAASLHALVAELATAHMSAADLHDMRAESERFTWAVWRREIEPAADADRRFHAVLASAAGSAQLRGLLERVMPALRRLERTAWPVMDERPGAEHHERLVAAVEARDASAAARSGGAEWNALGEAVERSLSAQDRSLSAQDRSL
jgi:DNA-binding GntR family transcriptional regulator